MAWMIYGANGYTGQLVAEAAAAAGERPGLAGRSDAPVRAVADRTVPFPRSGPRPAIAIPCGDLATAHRSTGIPDITIYMAMSSSALRLARLQRLFAPALGLAPVQAFLKRRIERRVRGPGPEER